VELKCPRVKFARLRDLDWLVLAHLVELHDLHAGKEVVLLLGEELRLIDPCAPGVVARGARVPDIIPTQELIQMHRRDVGKDGHPQGDVLGCKQRDAHVVDALESDRSFVKVLDHLRGRYAIFFRDAGYEELGMNLGAFSLGEPDELMHNDVELESVCRSAGVRGLQRQLDDADCVRRVRRKYVKRKVLNTAFKDRTEGHVCLAYKGVCRHASLDKRVVKTEVLRILGLVEVLVHLPHLPNPIVKLLQAPEVNH